MRVIHWFRSDLRAEDNRALAAACARASELVPVFVLDDALLERHRESHPRLRFLRACLLDLARRLEGAGSTLVILRGAPQLRVPELARACGASLVTWNRDYGPYAKRRDRAVRRALARDGVEAHECKDRVVFDRDEIRTGKGEPYSVYTPYRRAWWRRYRADPPREAQVPSRVPPIADLGSIDDPALGSLDLLLGGRPGVGSKEGPPPTTGSVVAAPSDASAIPRGGAGAARARLDAFLDAAARRYHVDRDFPALAGTSRLSPFLRFGAVSVRTCFHAGLACARDEPEAHDGVSNWLNELVWREFYHAILDAHPHVLDGPFRPVFEGNRMGRPPRPPRRLAGGHDRVSLRRRRNASARRDRLDAQPGANGPRRASSPRTCTSTGEPANAGSCAGSWTATPRATTAAGSGRHPRARMRSPGSGSSIRRPRANDSTRAASTSADGSRSSRGWAASAAHRPWDTPTEARGYPPPIVDHRHERSVALARYRAVRVNREKSDP